jgi:hypothetical protein
MSSGFVIEVESGGGLTNLVKYWPMPGAELGDKRFVLADLFMISSESDYIAHRSRLGALATVSGEGPPENVVDLAISMGDDGEVSVSRGVPD